MAKGRAELWITIKETGSKALSGIKSGLSGIKNAAQVAAAALIAVGAGIAKLAGDAAKFDTVEKAFGQLALKQGQDAQKMLNNMRKLSAGTVSDLELMRQANQAMMLGLPVDKFDQMLNIARSSAKATGQSMEFMLNSIVTGLGRQSKLMIDNLGIMVDVNQANQEYADKLGINVQLLTDQQRKTAFVNKVLEIGTANAEAAGGAQVDLSDGIAQTMTRMQNMAIVIGRLLQPALQFLLGSSNKYFDELEQWVRSSSAVEFFQFLTKTIATLKNGFVALGETMGTILGAAFQSISEAAAGNFSAAGQYLKLGLEDLKQIGVDAILKTQEDFNEIDNLFKESQKEKESAFNTDITAIKAAQVAREKELALQAKKDKLKIQEALQKEQKKLDDKKAAEDEKRRQEELKQQNAFFSAAISLSSAKNKALMLIGKAAALTQIAIKTPEAIASSFAFGTRVGGPVLGYALGGIAATAMAAQAARVAGVQLAEGGIVRATPGGVAATVAEAGQDEAVIPLDDPDEGIGSRVGGNITVNFNAPVMGDEVQAREFALVLDRELAKLRLSNESQSFDQDLI